MRRLKTKIPKRMPEPSKPDAALRLYHKNLVRYAAAYARLMKEALGEILPDLKETAAEELPEVRTDSVHKRIRMDGNAEKKIRDTLDAVQAELETLFPESVLRRWAQAMIGSVNKTEKKNMKRMAARLGFNVEPLMHDRDLSPYFRNVVDENVGLIRSIPKQHLEVLKNGLVNAITRDMSHDFIRKMIQKNFAVTRSKAKVIARDQVGKLNGAINQYRQQQLGGKRYVWDGAMDERERPDHKRLQGKTFRWDSPPIVDRKSGRRGHPGEDYCCRCRARMIVEDILE